ncbi:MAG: NifB/NifX family molybdenum-iron cluster-binding protein [Porticoccaceae bacterium]
MDMMSSVSCVTDLNAPADVLLVAFASQDGDMVDQHFGSASAFYLYAITAERADLLTTQEFGHEKKDGNEDKLKPKLSWLAGSDIVYCGSVGGSATRQLIALGINPVQVKGGPEVEELIEELQRQLKGTPEFWLANILKQKQKTTANSRFDSMDEEGWDG